MTKTTPQLKALEKTLSSLMCEYIRALGDVRTLARDEDISSETRAAIDEVQDFLLDGYFPVSEMMWALSNEARQEEQNPAK